MSANMKERRFSKRIKAEEDVFVNVNDCLCKVHDISLDGIAFEYIADSDSEIQPSDTLEIFFMSGPILYIENIPYTIVAEIQLQPNSSHLRRICTRFDDLNFRQIVSFNHLLGDRLSA